MLLVKKKTKNEKLKSKITIRVFQKIDLSPQYYKENPIIFSLPLPKLFLNIFF